MILGPDFNKFVSQTEAASPVMNWMDGDWSNTTHVQDVLLAFENPFVIVLCFCVCCTSVNLVVLHVILDTVRKHVHLSFVFLHVCGVWGSPGHIFSTDWTFSVHFLALLLINI